VLIVKSTILRSADSVFWKCLRLGYLCDWLSFLANLARICAHAKHIYLVAYYNSIGVFVCLDIAGPLIRARPRSRSAKQMQGVVFVSFGPGQPCCLFAWIMLEFTLPYTTTKGWTEQLPSHVNTKSRERRTDLSNKTASRTSS